MEHRRTLYFWRYAALLANSGTTDCQKKETGIPIRALFTDEGFATQWQNRYPLWAETPQRLVRPTSPKEEP